MKSAMILLFNENWKKYMKKQKKPSHNNFKSLDFTNESQKDKAQIGSMP